MSSAHESAVDALARKLFARGRTGAGTDAYGDDDHQVFSTGAALITEDGPGRSRLLVLRLPVSRVFEGACREA